MINLIANAIPFFLMSVAVEACALRHHAHDHAADHDAAAPIGYETKDTRTSLTDGDRAPGHLLGLEAGHGRGLLGDLPALPAAHGPRQLVGLGAPVLLRRPRLLHLPPRPPPDPRLLGDPRRPPQLDPLQPLDCPAPGLDAVLVDLLLGAAGDARLPALDDLPGHLLEPALPVLDPHREDRPAPALVRGGLQHPLPPPRPPRLQRAVPRPQLRRDPDRLGPPLRQLRAGARACPLRPDDEHRDVQPAPGRISRVGRRLARRPRRAHLAPASRVHVQGSRLATRPAGETSLTAVSNTALIRPESTASRRAA